MKRLAVILLLALYTSFNLGVVISLHYCCGKVSSISLINSEKNFCGSCGKKQVSKNCCKDTSHYISISDHQIGSQTNFSLKEASDFSILPELFFVPIPVQGDSYASGNCLYTFETGPPVVPIYIQLHSLII